MKNNFNEEICVCRAHLGALGADRSDGKLAE